MPFAPDSAAAPPPDSLTAGILEALPAGPLTCEQLAPLDQFHWGGLAATDKLIRLAQPQAGDHILDVGCGPGGTARRLAATLPLHISAIDLDPDMLMLARALTSRTASPPGGLPPRFLPGNALTPPFPPGSFDQVFCQFVSMNIADRCALAQAFVRMLRPGGVLALHEICLGPKTEALPAPDFPLPWASTPAHSHLLPAGDWRQLLEQAGLEMLHWHCDDGGAAPRPNDSRPARPAPAPAGDPAISLRLLLGDSAGQRVKNLAAALQSGTLSVLTALCRKPVHHADSVPSSLSRR